MIDTNDNELINRLKKIQRYAEQLRVYNNYRVHYANKCDIFSCLFTEEVNKVVGKNEEYDTKMNNTVLIDLLDRDEFDDDYYKKLVKRQACSPEVLKNNKDFKDFKDFKEKKLNHINLLKNVRQIFIHKNEELRGNPDTQKHIPKDVKFNLQSLPSTTGGGFFFGDGNDSEPYEFFFNLYDDKINDKIIKTGVELKEIKEQIDIKIKKDPNYLVYSYIDFEDFIVFLYLLLLCEFLLNIPGNESSQNKNKKKAALKKHIEEKIFLSIEEINFKKATLSSGNLNDFLFSEILLKYIDLDKILLQKFLKFDENGKKIFDFWFQIIDKHFNKKKKKKK